MTSAEFSIIFIPRHIQIALLSNNISLDLLANITKENRNLLADISKYDLNAVYALNIYMNNVLYNDSLESKLLYRCFGKYIDFLNQPAEINKLAIETLGILANNFGILLKENGTSDSAQYTFNVYDNAIFITLNDNILLDNNSKKSFINDLVKTLFTTRGDIATINTTIFPAYVKTILNTIY